MKTYEECKEIAVERASAFDVAVDKAYKLGENYVFDSSTTQCVGVLPMVVDTENGNICGLWHYLNKAELSMDDMQEIEF